MKTFKFLFLLFGFYTLIVFNNCSSDTEGDTKEDAGKGSGVRVCKNSAQCSFDEECIDSVCVKKSPKDAESDTHLDTNTSDASDDIDTGIISDSETDIEIIDSGLDSGTDIRDIDSQYRIGISSVYDGTANECSNDEYILRSVSGYSGMSIMTNEDYHLNPQARFK